MSPLSLRRTDEVPPPPPSRPRGIVALGDLLTTRKGGPVARFPAPPPMPRVPVYSRARARDGEGATPSRIRELLVARDPFQVALAAIGVGVGVGVALGLGGALVAARASRRSRGRRFAQHLALTLRREIASLTRR